MGIFGLEKPGLIACGRTMLEGAHKARVGATSEAETGRCSGGGEAPDQA
jgi:hypothetical protein